MYLESSIDLLSDNRKVTQLMLLEKWEDFHKVKQTLHIVYEVYEKINSSIHRKMQRTHV